MKKSEKTKQQIFDISISLFKTKGVKNTSVNEIVKHLGKAKGTFFNYYPKKEDLVKDIIDKEFSDYFSVPKTIVGNKELNAAQKLQQVLLSLFSRFTTTSTLQEIFKFGIEAQYQNYINELRLSVIIPIMAEIIEQGTNEKIFRVKNAEFTASIITRGITSLIQNIYTTLADEDVFNEFLHSLDDLLNNTLNTTAPFFTIKK